MSTPPVEITGVRTSPRGEVILVELEAASGGDRFAFGQSSTLTHVCGVVVDGRPRVLLVGGDGAGALALPADRVAPLPTVRHAGALTERSIHDAFAPLVAALADGLYSVTRRALPRPVVLGESFTPLAPGPVVVDAGAFAGDDGSAVVGDLGDGRFVLLGGRSALAVGEPALVLSPSFVVAADGFAPHKHDRGAREAFARSPRVLFDDGAMRDAIAHRSAHTPRADLGPLALATVEPAWALALMFFDELAAADGITRVGGVGRNRDDVRTTYAAEVTCAETSLAVALKSGDGRALSEAIILHGDKVRAEGLKPAARVVARAVREAARERGTR